MRDRQLAGNAGNHEPRRELQPSVRDRSSIHRPCSPPPVPPTSGQCATDQDPACPWIEFLRSEEYGAAPEIAATAFLGLVAAALSEGDDRTASQAVISVGREPSNRSALGNALAGGPPTQLKGELYNLQALPGCLRVNVAAGRPLRQVVVRNRFSRATNSCPAP